MSVLLGASVAFAAMHGCSSEPSPGSAGDASGLDAQATDASADASTGAAYDPAALYDLAEIMDLSRYDVLVAEDTVLNAGSGRFVRSITYGIGHGGYPLPETVYGISGQLFVESNASGEPLADTSSVALALYSGVSSPGFTIDCALQSGVVCVVAARSVLGPSELEPRYLNEFDDPRAPIEDSNLLLWNMLSEMRRGTRADGAALERPLVRRAYVVNIAEASMRLISATQKVLVDRSLAATPPQSFVVTGHSKWGGAAAQLAAVDPRVKGALASGWTIDWVRWIELARDHWVGQLGIDAWSFFCAPDKPCEWTETARFADFMLSTAAEPDDCGGAPCPGTGHDWLRQLDLRHLIEAGAFDGKKLALLRNGREAHQIELESEAFEQGATVDQFLFLPLASHVQNTPDHAALWRHWVRHVLANAATPKLLNLRHNGASGQFSVSAAVGGATSIDSADVWLRPSYDGSFGSLDAIPAYQSLCAANDSCASWQRVPMQITGSELSADAIATGYAAGTEIAYVVHISFDDGSGDLAKISSPVQFTTLP